MDEAMLTGVLGMVLRYEATGCPRIAMQLAVLFSHLAELPGVDVQVCELYERASTKYFDLGER